MWYPPYKQDGALNCELRDEPAQACRLGSVTHENEAGPRLSLQNRRHRPQEGLQAFKWKEVPMNPTVLPATRPRRSAQGLVSSYPRRQNRHEIHRVGATVTRDSGTPRPVISVRSLADGDHGDTALRRHTSSIAR